jgi:cyclic pyranopterin phosphate synthase
MRRPLTASVIVVSDSVASGLSEDLSGKRLAELLTLHDMDCLEVSVVPDDIERIRNRIEMTQTDLVACTGGTGVGPRDVTPEAVEPLIEKRLSGVEEVIRAYGQTKNPRAMLSRTVVGVIGEQLILCLPGSPAGVEDAMNAVFPSVLHVFEVLNGAKH